MKKLIFIILAQTYASAATTPISCYWCVSTGQTWSNDKQTCLSGSDSKAGLTLPKECTDNTQYQIDNVDITYYDGGYNSTFSNSAIQRQVEIPVNKNDSLRESGFLVYNIQPGLELEVNVECDKKQVIGYLVKCDIECDQVNSTYCQFIENLSAENFTTQSFSCGEKTRIKFKQIALLAMIQNTGSSTVKLQTVFFKKSKSVVLIVILSVLGAVAAIGLTLYLIQRHLLTKRLAQHRKEFLE